MQLVTEDEYLSWAAGRREFFESGKSKLLAREGRLAEGLLVRTVERAHGSIKTVHLGNPEYTRSAAWEDLDCKVGRGFFAIDSAGLGVETRRKLDPQRYKPIVWRGSEAFHALFRRILRMHCLHEILDHRPRFFPIEEMPEEFFEPDDMAVTKADAIRHLSQFQEILLRDNRRSIAQTAGAVVKQLEQPGILLSDWQHDSFWNDVGARVGVRGNALAQRKHRYFDSLVDMREELPEWLQIRARRMLASEAEAAMEDLVRLRGEIGGPVMEAIFDYYLAFLAKQHPDYAHKSLDEIRLVDLALLVRRHDNPDVNLWPPPGPAFEDFCRANGFIPGDPIEQARAWIAEVAGLKPPPKRALSVLELTFIDPLVAADGQDVAYVD